MNILISIIAFLILIGVLVFIHELGHYLAARSVGVTVEKFSIGMPPTVYSYKPKNSKTVFAIGGIPLGGYVQMKGIVDESMESSFTGADDELESKSALAKIWVMSAGVIFNIILAFFVFVCIGNLPGGIQEPKDNLPIIDGFKSQENLLSFADNDPVIDIVIENSIAENVGIKKGDKILSINNQPIATWTDILNYMSAIRKDSTNSEEQNIAIILDREGDIFTKNAVISREQPLGVGSYPLTLTRKGDKILSINNQPIATWTDIEDYIRDRPGQSFEMLIERDGETISIDKMIKGDGETDKIRIGSSMDLATGRVDKLIGDLDIVKATRPAENIKFKDTIFYGIERTKFAIILTVSSFKLLFEGKVSKDDVGSVIMIGQMAGQTAQEGLIPFLGLMAFISVNLAFINILPIPGLDGGHIMIILIEVLMRRKFSVKTRMRIQSIGMFILLSLMIFLLINDIARFF